MFTVTKIPLNICKSKSPGN